MIVALLLAAGAALLFFSLTNKAEASEIPKDTGRGSSLTENLDLAARCAAGDANACMNLSLNILPAVGTAMKDWIHGWFSEDPRNQWFADRNMDFGGPLPSGIKRRGPYEDGWLKSTSIPADASKTSFIELGPLYIRWWETTRNNIISIINTGAYSGKPAPTMSGIPWVTVLAYNWNYIKKNADKIPKEAIAKIKGPWESWLQSDMQQFIAPNDAKIKAWINSHPKG